MKEDLESLIKRYIILGSRSSKGWETVKCAKCLDYKERGSFKFENGSVFYNCFNCATKGVYEAGSTELGKPLREVLESFGVPPDELKKCIAQTFFNPKVQNQVEPEKKTISFPVTQVPLPTGSVKVSSGLSPWCEVCIEYLKSRSLDNCAFEFFVSDETSYAGRLLIPYWFRSKIIYWQGRSMDPSIEPRYKNPYVEKENIFFNMDEIYRYTDEPLFIAEGPLDAISIGSNAVALAGGSLSEFQMLQLIKAGIRRKVIFILDKNKIGYKLGMKVLEASDNFYVTAFPDNIEDANDAKKELGQLWLSYHLATTAVKDFAGKLMITAKCK